MVAYSGFRFFTFPCEGGGSGVLDFTFPCRGCARVYEYGRGSEDQAWLPSDPGDADKRGGPTVGEVSAW